jgi:uncharacterized protein with GYD domain
MTTFVSLINWTEQGIKNFRDTTQRAEEFSKLVQSSGGRVRELLWTVGEYDFVCVADFPDEEAGVAVLLRLGSAGNIRSKTLRAFGSEEMVGIIGRAGLLHGRGTLAASWTERDGVATIAPLLVQPIAPDDMLRSWPR